MEPNRTGAFLTYCTRKIRFRQGVLGQIQCHQQKQDGGGGHALDGALRVEADDPAEAAAAHREAERAVRGKGREVGEQRTIGPVVKYLLEGLLLAVREF